MTTTGTQDKMPNYIAFLSGGGPLIRAKREAKKSPRRIRRRNNGLPYRQCARTGLAGLHRTTSEGPKSQFFEGSSGANGGRSHLFAKYIAHHCWRVSATCPP